MKAALYARFSTEKQSENSIEDQFRVCERLAERHGFASVARYSDAAISGGTADRPGYQAMLEAARRHEFDVIVAEDTSRLWRLLAEQAPRLAELADLGIAVVTHDLDTRQESAAVLGAVNGAMSEQYRKEIARRTRRGLEGLARQQKSTGGRAYGYVSATDSPTGRREINPEQAEVVRRIFGLYLGGKSPRTIAATLNAEGIPSPGSSWSRSLRRKSGWLASAIAGDPERGTGILNNELYVGRVIWNRFRWVRSAADSSKRRCELNAQSDWIVHEDESLRIVPQDVWDQARSRQRSRIEHYGSRVRQGLADAPVARTGRKPKFLFSSLLVCAECGAKFVMADRRHYACSSRVNGGPAACRNDVRVARDVVESGLLAGIQERLLTPEVLREITRSAVEILKKQEQAPRADQKAIDRLEGEVANLLEAVASGAFKSSPALAGRLAAAEQELARLRAAQAPKGKAANVHKLAARMADEAREMVAALPAVLNDSRIVDRARAELRNNWTGEIRIEADEEWIYFRNEQGRMEAALLRAAGGTANNLVAGACFRDWRQMATSRLNCGDGR